MADTTIVTPPSADAEVYGAPASFLSFALEALDTTSESAVLSLQRLDTALLRFGQLAQSLNRRRGRHRGRLLRGTFDRCRRDRMRGGSPAHGPHVPDPWSFGEIAPGRDRKLADLRQHILGIDRLDRALDSSVADAQGGAALWAGWLVRGRCVAAERGGDGTLDAAADLVWLAAASSTAEAAAASRPVARRWSAHAASAEWLVGRAAGAARATVLRVVVEVQTSVTTAAVVVLECAAVAARAGIAARVCGGAPRAPRACVASDTASGTACGRGPADAACGAASARGRAPPRAAATTAATDPARTAAADGTNAIATSACPARSTCVGACRERPPRAAAAGSRCKHDQDECRS